MTDLGVVVDLDVPGSGEEDWLKSLPGDKGWNLSRDLKGFIDDLNVLYPVLTFTQAFNQIMKLPVGQSIPRKLYEEVVLYITSLP